MFVTAAQAGQGARAGTFFESATAMPLFPLPAETAPSTTKAPIAVIGAGFSGTMATLHLLRNLPPDQPILLCERAREFGKGVAYATGESCHLLNVRAANMSALADQPLHFQEWLQDLVSAGGAPEGIHKTSAGLFASRGLYGQYLRSILDNAIRESAGDARLRLLPDEVADIEPRPEGGFTIIAASGQKIAAAGVVLAVGNLPPAESEDPRICTDAWSAKASAPLEADKPLLIVGTGLTMVDIAVGLRRKNFAGGIIALSRAGLLPQRHAMAGPWPTPALTELNVTSMRALTALVRAQVRDAARQGVDWRSVIDSLRPITAALWSGFSLPERQRFLRHVRRYWDVHRHRMAPIHADLVDAMLADGSLRIAAGRIRAITPTGGGVRVRYAPRAGGPEKMLDVQRVIMASGLEPITVTRDALLQRLLARGLIRMDRQGFGIDVAENLAVLQADGTQASQVWALGPIVRGVFWECVAVPDIRVQAERVADSVAARQSTEAPRWSFSI